MSMQTIAVTFVHPRNSCEFPAEIGVATTGQECIGSLIQEQFLTATERFHAYIMTNERTGRRVALDRPLTEWGVHDGDRLQVELVPRFM